MGKVEHYMLNAPIASLIEEILSLQLKNTCTLTTNPGREEVLGDFNRFQVGIVLNYYAWPKGREHKIATETASFLMAEAFRGRTDRSKTDLQVNLDNYETPPANAQSPEAIRSVYDLITHRIVEKPR